MGCDAGPEASKLLTPDHYEDKNAALIVVDFGKPMNAVKLETTRSSGKNRNAEVNEDGDLFLTPASYPGEETEEKFMYPDKGQFQPVRGGLTGSPVVTNDHAWPSFIISAFLPRLQLHFIEKVITLKPMVTRLLGTDYGGRKAACT